MNSLKLQDMDSRAPGSEGLDRPEKIWGGNFREFDLRSWRDLHGKEKHRHRLFPLQNGDGYSGAVSLRGSIGSWTRTLNRGLTLAKWILVASTAFPALCVSLTAI